MNAEYDYDCDLPDVQVSAIRKNETFCETKWTITIQSGMRPSLFSLQEVALIRQPPQLELRLEGMMKNMLAIEDAHERLRYVWVLSILSAEISLEYGLDTHSTESCAETTNRNSRISAYCPRLVEGLTVDDVTAGPSKLGMNFGVRDAMKFLGVAVKRRSHQTTD